MAPSPEWTLVECAPHVRACARPHRRRTRKTVVRATSLGAGTAAGRRSRSLPSSSISQPADRLTLAAALLAAGLGLLSAATSAYWALGGDALLDTVGGDIERWGRARSTGVVVILWVVVALKAAVAGAAPVLAGVGERLLPRWTVGRGPRTLGWIAAIVLAAYGGVLTAVGMAVQLGILTADAGADEHALTWHTYLWDPWFALWGGSFAVVLWRSRRVTETSPLEARPGATGRTSR